MVNLKEESLAPEAKLAVVALAEQVLSLGFFDVDRVLAEKKAQRVTTKIVSAVGRSESHSTALGELTIRRADDERPVDDAVGHVNLVGEIPPDIEELAERRWAARQAKDFAESDRLRDALAESGYTVRDRKDGYDLVPSAGGG